MENRDFKKTIDLNVMTSKFLNLLNSIILNQGKSKIKIFELLF